MVDCSNDHVVHLVGKSILNKFDVVVELFRVVGATEIKGQILGVDLMLENGCLGTKCQCSSDGRGVNSHVGREMMGRWCGSDSLFDAGTHGFCSKFQEIILKLFLNTCDHVMEVLRLTGCIERKRELLG